MGAPFADSRGAAAYYSPSLLAFAFLQLLDVATTWLGLRLGLSEASPFVQILLQVGPLAGLLASKAIAVCLAAFCVWRGRFRVIRVINYWYAALVIWNLALIVTR